ncbi:DUF6069 family protein [Vicingaceae bacterium]|nr:DUF6069 family protein [Vicingaceae bacterium]MDB4061476.1 DUF6069 family protein [Vicingaceae bacterium]MDC1451262.1 DUF6069 family protein [Vicingaceae bacterium]
MTSTESIILPQHNNRLTTFLTTGLISGVAAAFLNLIYMYLHKSITSFSIPEVINIGSVALASLIPGIISGIYYFILRRIMTDKNALVTFLGTLAFITLVSLLGPLSNGLPDGIITPDEFSGLSIPMHIIAVSFYSVMIVRSVTRS